MPEEKVFIQPRAITPRSSRARLTPKLGLHVDRIVAAVRQRANIIAADVAKGALQVAKAKAPVRKIFKGRQTSWQRISMGAPGWYSQGRVDVIKTTWDQMTNKRYMMSNNGWQQTWFARLARIDNPEYHRGELVSGRVSLEGGYEKYLTTRGRWEVRNAIRRGSLLEIGPSILLNDPEARRKSEATAGQMTVGGRLRASIEFEDRSSGDIIRKSIIAGGKSAPYAKFVEFGTRRSRAQPFLRPALKHAETIYPQKMRAAMRAFGQVK